MAFGEIKCFFAQLIIEDLLGLYEYLNLCALMFKINSENSNIVKLY